MKLKWIKIVPVGFGCLFCFCPWVYWVYGEDSKNTVQGEIHLDTVSFFGRQITPGTENTIVGGQEGVNAEAFHGFVFGSLWPMFQQWFSATVHDIEPELKRESALVRALEELAHTEKVHIGTKIPLVLHKITKEEIFSHESPEWDVCFQYGLYDKITLDPKWTLLMQDILDNGPHGPFPVNTAHSAIPSQEPYLHLTYGWWQNYTRPKVYSEPFFLFLREFRNGGKNCTMAGICEQLNVMSTVANTFQVERFYYHFVSKYTTAQIEIGTPKGQFIWGDKWGGMLPASVPASLKICVPISYQVMVDDAGLQKYLDEIVFNPGLKACKPWSCDERSYRVYGFFNIMAKKQPKMAKEFRDYLFDRIRNLLYRKDTQICMTLNHPLALQGLNAMEYQVFENGKRTIRWNRSVSLDGMDTLPILLSQHFASFFAEDLPVTMRNERVAHHWEKMAYRTLDVPKWDAKQASVLAKALLRHFTITGSFEKLMLPFSVPQNHQAQFVSSSPDLAKKLIYWDGKELLPSDLSSVVDSGDHTLHIPSISWETALHAPLAEGEGKWVLVPVSAGDHRSLAAILERTPKTWGDGEVGKMFLQWDPKTIADAARLQSLWEEDLQRPAAHFIQMLKHLDMATEEVPKWSAQLGLSRDDVQEMFYRYGLVVSELSTKSLERELAMAKEQESKSQKRYNSFRSVYANLEPIVKMGSKKWQDILAQQKAGSYLDKLEYWADLLPDAQQKYVEKLRTSRRGFTLTLVNHVVEWVETLEGFAPKSGTVPVSQKEQYEVVQAFLTEFLREEQQAKTDCSASQTQHQTLIRQKRSLEKRRKFGHFLKDDE